MSRKIPIYRTNKKVPKSFWLISVEGYWYLHMNNLQDSLVRDITPVYKTEVKGFGYRVEIKTPYQDLANELDKESNDSLWQRIKRKVKR